MKKTEAQTKREKYDATEEKAFPKIRADLTEAVEEKMDKLKNVGGASVMKSDAAFQTAVDSPSEGMINTNFIAKKSGLAVCQPGQDEVFDNCQPAIDAVERQEEAEDSAWDTAANPTEEQQSSREYGFAAMDFLKNVNSELETPGGSFIAQGTGCGCVTIVHCQCEEPAAKTPAENPGPEIPIEKVEEVVAAARKKADEKIEKIVQKEETKKDGLIDLMSRTLAKNAKTKQEIRDNRSEIESMVKTRIAAATELGDQVRGALQGGIKATQAKQAPETKKAIEGMALLREEELKRKQK